MKTKSIVMSLALASIFNLKPPALVLAAPLGTAFTYQGRLKSAGQALNGAYDFKFTLYDAAGGGAPVAQDFHAAFGLGPDDKAIATIGAGGVALAAIQGLNQKVESGRQKAESRMEKLEAENAELKARLQRLEHLLARQDGGAR